MVRNSVRWPLVCLGLGACLAPPVESPVTTVEQQTDVLVDQDIKNKVDILFLIDDSPSMKPKQDELKLRFPELIKLLDKFGGDGNPAWYHIGVVTSDLGAGPTSPTSNCKGTGLGARLQPLGRQHGLSCLPPGNGLSFIDYNQLNGTDNLPAGQDMPTTFTCMASVGDEGCGFEQQLEASYRALHDCMPDASGGYPSCAIPENRGFLRPDSLLVVVFVTDEDDGCSAPLDTDLYDLNKASMYGPLQSYRASRFGVMCNYGGMDQLLPQMDSGGPLASCHAAPNPATVTGNSGNSSGLPPAGQGKCFDIERYVNFFKKPLSEGGVRANPADVLLAAIDAPSDPVQTILGNPAVQDPNSPGGYAACPAGALPGSANCQVLLGHSCNRTIEFFGDPAVRINEMITRVDPENAQSITSICSQEYTSALTSLGAKIIKKLGIACLNSPITDVEHPDCTVEDRAIADNRVVDSIQSCASTNGQQPCWKYVENDKCQKVVNPKDGSITQGSITVDRDPSTIPPGTKLRVACATIAHAGGTAPSPSP